MNENFGNKNTKRDFPDTSRAKWLDPDTFVVDGITYRMNLDCTISKVKDAL